MPRGTSSGARPTRTCQVTCSLSAPIPIHNRNSTFHYGSIPLRNIRPALLILLGDGVVANVVLKTPKATTAVGSSSRSLGHGGVRRRIVSASDSGAHLNPAVTVALAAAGKLNGPKCLFTCSPNAGAVSARSGLGALQTGISTRRRAMTGKLAVFAPLPPFARPGQTSSGNHWHRRASLCGVAHHESDGGLGSLDALPVALVVLVIGLSWGARPDCYQSSARSGPRLMQRLLPLPTKGTAIELRLVPVLDPSWRVGCGADLSRQL